MWYVMSNVQEAYNLSNRLIRAISNWQTVAGENDDIEALLDQGADVNRQHGTLLPLHCACMVADAYTLRLLLERGAEVNSLDGYGRAAMHYAAEKDATCVELLLAHGADPNVRDSNDDTALHWAAFKNNPRCVRALLQQGALVNPCNYNMDTPLSWAVHKGSLESIKILLEYNALINTVNLNGVTPILRAAGIQAAGLNTDKDDACLELLLKANGQFDFRMEDGTLPDPVGRDNKLCELLLPYCQNARPLQQLCRHALRQFLGNQYLPNVVPRLPIPSSLQELLLLQR